MFNIGLHMSAKSPEAVAAKSHPVVGTHMRRDRKRGHPTQHLGIRCPDELMDAAEAEGPDQSKGAIALMDRGLDVKTAAGKDWIEVVVRAHRESEAAGKVITEGEVAGKMIRELLELQRKGKR